MRKHVRSFSYKPKIEAVFSGKCRQTIRKVADYRHQIKETHMIYPGDQILFHTWSGRPRYSSWDQRMTVTVKEVIPITITNYTVVENDNTHSWRNQSDPFLIDLAKRDFIDPPTPEELKNVLKTLNRYHGWMGKYLVIRW